MWIKLTIVNQDPINDGIKIRIVSYVVNREQTDENATGLSEMFNKRLNRKLLGRKWSEKKDLEVQWIWFLHNGTQQGIKRYDTIHYHGFTTVPEEHECRFPNTAQDIQRNLVTSGKLSIEVCHPNKNAKHDVTHEWTNMGHTKQYLFS